MIKPIVLAGDLHGDARHLFNNVVPVALEAGADRIIALGDFGFFFSTLGAIEAVSAFMVEHGIELWFLDGNHENFDWMADYGFYPSMLAMGVEGYDNGPVRSEDLPNIVYLPRGSTFEWDGKTFMAFGGAFSIDVGRRTPHISWWTEETINEGQVRLVEDMEQNVNPKVDVLLTHDCPELPPVLGDFLAHGYDLPYKLDEASRANRKMLRRVFDAVQPDSLYHGHYHHAYKDTLAGCAITGLACNGMPHSVAILEPQNQTTNDKDTQP